MVEPLLVGTLEDIATCYKADLGFLKDYRQFLGSALWKLDNDQIKKLLDVAPEEVRAALPDTADDVNLPTKDAGGDVPDWVNDLNQMDSAKQSKVLNKILGRVKNLHQLAKYEQYSNHSCVVHSCIILESFFKAYLRQIYMAYPDALAKGDPIPRERLLEVADQDSMIELLVEMQLANLHQRFPSQVKKHFQQFGIPLAGVNDLLKQCQPKIEERHRIVHTYQLRDDGLSEVDCKGRVSSTIELFIELIDAVHRSCKAHFGEDSANNKRKPDSRTK